MRDTVFERVLKYLDFIDIDIFWIDRVCIDQKHQARKAKAVNSRGLDLPQCYESPWTLDNSYTYEARFTITRNPPGRPNVLRTENVFQQGTSYNDIMRIIRLLRDLTRDPWWSRAWVFQEEYLSGLRMDILIPIAPGLRDLSKNSTIPNEFCVGASIFRERAKIFLLAYLNTSYKEVRALCQDILGVVFKYNIVLPRHKDGLRSMSAQISADIGQRGITKPWDVLAVTANAYGYRSRLDANSLKKGSHSLSLSLLAQFLLNGEVTRSGPYSAQDRNDPIDVDVARFLDRISLQDLSLPVEPRRLSFFTNCRLPMI